LDTLWTSLTLYYVQNRAGTIAASQVPLVTVLGTKHNAIGWLTGVGYDKINYLHRSAARTLLIVTWVHAGAHVSRALLGFMFCKTLTDFY
jgi:ferric-chelate reductase